MFFLSTALLPPPEIIMSFLVRPSFSPPPPSYFSSLKIEVDERGKEEGGTAATNVLPFLPRSSVLFPAGDRERIEEEKLVVVDNQ